MFDENWCAHTLTLDQNLKIVRKNDSHHGIIFCNTPLDLYNPYVEFKVKIEAVFRGKSHLFVGLVDKNKQRKEYLSKELLVIILVSTYWKDSPSSMYWDVWNTKLIKTDDKGH